MFCFTFVNARSRASWFLIPYNKYLYRTAVSSRIEHMRYGLSFLVYTYLVTNFGNVARLEHLVWYVLTAFTLSYMPHILRNYIGVSSYVHTIPHKDIYLTPLSKLEATFTVSP